MTIGDLVLTCINDLDHFRVREWVRGLCGYRGVWFLSLDDLKDGSAESNKLLATDVSSFYVDESTDSMTITFVGLP